ncbi:sugar ABC transporter ATP-binding protein [Botrimarina sp.]|uniref:sugar ABC transporter ATP-binding protein n=1 Tax=Botrimarina sp. TaxID=2795802 RepID=UPI0032EC5DB5
MSLPACTAEPVPVLEARGVVKTFPGVRALDGVDLRLRAGRLNALMGENGAGKSTLMKVMAGVHPPDAGEVLLDGAPVNFRNTREAQAAGVAIIHQELNLADNLSVAENLFLGREPTGPLGFINRSRMRDEARRLMRRMGVDIDPDTRVGRLSVATQQVVEIAKALALDARVLILDEPTSALTARETDALFERIAQLKSEGVALAYITHRFEELERIADDVTVFRDGRLVGERPYPELSRDELVRMMIGREAPSQAPVAPKPRADAMLVVRGLTLASSAPAPRPLLDGVSLEVGRGEVVALFGLMGAGRTELLEALFGLHAKRTTGEVIVDGRRLTPRSPRQMLRSGVGLAPEDRKAAGLVLGLSVEENLTMATLRRLQRGGLLSRRAQHDCANRYVERMRIKTPSLAARVRNLSGGNQQKVVLGKVLATDPKVLLLDEPTRGIDVGAKQEVYALVRELAAEGRAVLVVSSEAPEVLMLGDRILVMSEGRLTAEFGRGEASEHHLIEAALPSDHPREAA